MEPGSLKALQCVIADAAAAREELAGRGVEVSEVAELAWGKFEDPDGNSWSLQELPDWSTGAGGARQQVQGTG